MIIKVVRDDAPTSLYETQGHINHQVVPVYVTDTEQPGGHSGAVFRHLDIHWEAIRQAHFLADETRDYDWHVTSDDGNTGEHGWTYRVVWWDGGREDPQVTALITTGSVYIMSDSGQTVEALR